MKTSRRTLLHASATASLLPLLTLPLAAQAIPFQLGPIKATIDTTVSVGVQMRTEDADPALIGIANGGTARSVNGDDGNLGFDSGDITSAVVKASHELEFKYQNYGVFSRVAYFYDAIASDADRFEDRRGANGFIERPRQRGEFELGPAGRDRLGSEFQLLDLFAYANVDIAGQAFSLRAGKQVVNWGESTFIGNSINVVNPVDVSRLRAPGAELKEALVPTPILFASTSLTKDWSVEAIYLAAYDNTRIDPRGSFFSTNDFVSDDGDRAIVSFGRRVDENSTTLGQPGNSAPAWVPRQGGRPPTDTTNQYGFATRYFAEALNNTEFGLFYFKYHSRTPLVSAFRGGQTASGGNATNAGNGANPLCSSQSTPTPNCRASFFSEFPSNIELYGLSFNTTAFGEIAVQGEYSYRPNQPLQLSGAEVLLASLGVSNSISGAPSSSQRTTAFDPGDYIQGFRNVKMHQVQTTLTRAFGPTFGAQQFVLLGEVGVTHLELPSNERFAGPGADLPACGFAAQTTLNAVSNGSCQSEGYATNNSWGYRAVGRLDFENVIGAIQLSPRLVLSHDVNGVGPTFNKDTKAVALGLGLNYLQRWQADLSYTSFFGGRNYSGRDPVAPGSPANPSLSPAPSPGHAGQPQSFNTSANPNGDRDFLSLSVSYAF